MITLTDNTLSGPALSGIVFDIDGVLFDSRDANISYYNLVREAVGLGPMSHMDEEYCHMATAKQSFQRIIPPELRERAAEKARGISYNDYSLPKLSLHTGVVELLSWLQAFGVRMGICTNRMSHVSILLRHFGIDHFFHPVKTAGNCIPKPSPQGLLEILAEWNMPASRIAFLGDTGVDEAAAKAAGVPFWGYRNRDLDARILVDDFFTLMEIIKPLVEHDNGV